MSVNRRYVIVIFLSLIMPLVFMINIYLFVGLILLDFFLLTYGVTGFGNKTAVLFLSAVLFSGISIAGLKLYDWVIMFSAFTFFFIKKEKISMPVKLVPFLIIVFFNAIIHYTGSSVIMVSLRYVICIMLVVVVSKAEFNFDKISNEIILVALTNLYFAVSVFFFMNAGRIIKRDNIVTLISGSIVQRIHPDDFVSVNLYVFSNEVRMNGFFSDPNKYMVFCFALLFVAEAFVISGRKKKTLCFLILISALLSLARTALIIIAAYFVLKFLYKIKEGYKRIFYISLCLCVSIMLFFVLMPDIINNAVNNMYVWSTEILGRTRALELSRTLQGDNRTRIWEMALSFIKEKPILGYGWLSNEYLLPYPTHNSVLELLLDGGAVTLVLYIYMFWPLIRYRRWDIVFSCYLVSSLMLDLASYRVWFFLLGLVLCKNIYNCEGTSSYENLNKNIEIGNV